MKFKTSPVFETVSIEGKEYEVHNGIVETDHLSPTSVKHLVEWHGLIPVPDDEPKKGK